MMTNIGLIQKHSLGILALVLGLGCGASTSPAFSADARAIERIGIYDSRVVAYAWFWSEDGTRKRDDLIAAARTAKESGDAERIGATEAAVVSFQETNHLQVFSTAPVEDLLELIRPKLAAIMADARVTRFVSQWDMATLDRLASAERIDVTDALVAAFLTPNEKQAKTIAGIKRAKPLPLKKARELTRAGTL